MTGLGTWSKYLKFYLLSKGESMSLTILETVTNASVRDKEKLKNYAVDNASAGIPWLD